MNQSPRYLVNEVFPCLQGEGPRLGTPSVLVRFQICNLRCSWCDTPYTHTFASDPLPGSGAANGRPPQRFFTTNATHLAQRIQKIAPHIRHLILSGGEPLLHNPLPLLSELKTYTAEVETNGTVIPHEKHASFQWEDYGRFSWNVSPKGSNAGCALDLSALEHWARLAQELPQQVTFKWVVRSKPSDFRADTQEIAELKQRLSLSPEQISLMPEGTTMNSQVAQTQLAEHCQSQGFRYTPRLHVILYGNERGR